MSHGAKALCVWLTLTTISATVNAGNDGRVVRQPDSHAIEPTFIGSSDPFLVTDETFLNDRSQFEIVPASFSTASGSTRARISESDKNIFGPFALSWTKHRLTTTFLAGSDDGLGITTVDLQTQLAPKIFPLVQASPRFAWHFLDRTDAIDLPSEVYEVAVDFSLFLPFSEQWFFLGGVAPGLFTDFENTSSDAFRMMARAIMVYKRSENLTFAFGFVYLDRDDVSALPAVGMIWSPQQSPNLTFDFMFPKPKIKYRLMKTSELEKQIYLGGEFGGGTWAVQRRSGPNDVATYSDLKLILGFESVKSNGMTWYVEGGYVFNRSLEFSTTPEMDFSDTGMIRVGLRF